MRQKGNRSVAKCTSILTSLGYRVENVENTRRFAKQRDLFNLYDLIAIHKENPPCLIQITSNRPHVHKLYLEFAGDYAKHFCILQMVVVDRQGFIAYIYHSNNTKTIVDGRKISTQEFTEKLKVALQFPTN